MGKSISLYPTINKELLEKMKFSLVEIGASYHNGFEEKELICNLEKSKSSISIEVMDDTGQWDLDKHDFKITGIINILNPKAPYEKRELIGLNDAIGVGLVLKSRMANVRGSQNIGVIHSDSQPMQITFEKTFEAATLRGSLEATVVLYMMKKLSTTSMVPEGAILGEPMELTFYLEGIGSTFSVFEKYAPGDPLWNIECDWEDPEYSMFSESVKVIINTAHPAWQSASDDEVRKELLKEIMATSMQVVIASLEPEQYSIGQEYEIGSVSSAVAYFADKAKLDNSSPATVASSVRRYIDEKMK